MACKIEILAAARKQILSFPRNIIAEVAGVIDGLADTPRPPGSRKLRSTDLWRVRVGRYRVIYAIDDKAALITVVKIALRREDTYQGL